MRWNLFSECLGIVFLASSGIAYADDIFLPAGTLVRCILDEPNFSSKTAEVGDPVLCRISSLPQFGRSAFPRDAYLMGVLEAYRDPGRFWGKGNLTLRFDRIGTQKTDLPVSGKVIAIRGYRVNRQGDIVGRGHPTRDLVQWMIPPLWPWKVVTLPLRGPYPTLKGEVPFTLRLMNSVTIPQVSSTPWRSFVQPSATRPSARPSAEPTPSSIQQREKLTLLVLRNGTTFGVTDYWIDEGYLVYTLADGSQRTTDLSHFDWRKTNQLNNERGVTVALRTANTPAGASTGWQKFGERTYVNSNLSPRAGISTGNRY